MSTSTDKPERTKEHYEFPYGDFNKVDRCGVLARQKQGQYKYFDIENAAAHLHGMVDAPMDARSFSRAEIARNKTARDSHRPAR